MRLLEVEKTIEIPESVDAKIDGKTVTITGEKGMLSRTFSRAPIVITQNKKVITIRTDWPRKKEAAIVGAVTSHIKNMVTGVTKGFTYKLKIVFSHFPISVKVEDGKVLIENFTGERKSRKAKIIGDTKVTVKSDDVIVQGINLQDVSQSAANIEQATKVKKKDPRVFLDGIYVFERTEAMES